MARITVPLVIGTAGVQAKAVSFQEVPGSYQPITLGKVDKNGVLLGVALGDPSLANVTVDVIVPDDEVTNGKYDAQKVSAKYPNHWLIMQGIIK